MNSRFRWHCLRVSLLRMSLALTEAGTDASSERKSTHGKLLTVSSLITIAIALLQPTLILPLTAQYFYSLHPTVILQLSLVVKELMSSQLL